MRLIDLALKDLRQIARDRQSAFFLLIMPILFTLLFGFAFGGFGGGGEAEDPRLPVGLLIFDESSEDHLEALLSTSPLLGITLEEEDETTLTEAVLDGTLAALIVVPAGYYDGLVAGAAPQVELVVDPAGTAAFAIQSELETALGRFQNAVQTATINRQFIREFGSPSAQSDHDAAFATTVAAVVAAWADPPVRVTTTATGAVPVDDADPEAVYGENAFAHSSPGMMAQFTLAGLITAAQVLIAERKNGSLRRLLTTNMSRGAILAGHFLAMFAMVGGQILILVLFGQLFLDLPYFREPIATFLLTFTSALFAASMGLLIGALAKSEEQAIIFSLVPMFLLAGLGGAWLPLEFTPPSFQQIAFLTPVAWMIDGFKDIIIRGQGVSAILTAAGVLMMYSLIFWLLAAWRFRFE